MIERFESGKWYRWIGGDDIAAEFNPGGMMDSIFDGKPHQCKKGAGKLASFFDCKSGNTLEWPITLFEIVKTENGETREVELTQEQIEQLGI
jgi:hypothetical protein